MKDYEKIKYSIKRIGGYLHKVVPVVDSTGKVVQQVIMPFMVELRPRDLMQIIVGATMLAIPVGFTEETWTLAEQLPFSKILLLGIISIIFIAAFVYFNFYRFHFKQHWKDYVKRVIVNYLLSLVIVGVLLTIIEKCPWGVDNLVAIKRIILVTFPASMSATLSDTIK